MNHRPTSISSQAPDFPALARRLDLSLEKPLGRRTWLARNAAEQLVVIKSDPEAAAGLHDTLGKFHTLFPPFQYPRISLTTPEGYLVYDFIPGAPLSESEFESETALAAAYDLSGRLSALFRSLRLAPMFKNWLHRGASSSWAPGGPQALEAGLDCQVDGMALRRWEASQSYAWAQDVVRRAREQWPAGEAQYAPPWPALSQRVENVTSIHLTAPGSNLAHTSFTPEHLLITPGEGWGVVGWQIAPRPYNFMRYRYLAWCLVRTAQTGLEARYRDLLGRLPTMDASAAHLLTFALCLIAAWVDAEPAIVLRREKLQALAGFVDEALTLTEATPI